MPLTSKGEDILSKMKSEYGDEKGAEVFYASRNAGTISGVDMEERKDSVRDYTATETKSGVWTVTRNSDGSKMTDIGAKEAKVAIERAKTSRTNFWRKDSAEEDRKDVEPSSMQQRLDTMAEQVNSLGQMAASVASRMDVSNIDKAQKLWDQASKLQKEAYEETALTHFNQIKRRKELLAQATLLRKEAQILLDLGN